MGFVGGCGWPERLSVSSLDYRGALVSAEVGKEGKAFQDWTSTEISKRWLAITDGDWHWIGVRFLREVVEHDEGVGRHDGEILHWRNEGGIEWSDSIQREEGTTTVRVSQWKAIVACWG